MAVECFITTGLVVVGGEVTSGAQVDIQAVVKKKLKDIGYTHHPDIGLDANSCAVLVVLNKQSPDIAQGVNENDGDFQEQGAGEGLTFGYACNQTDEYMPLPIILSHKLMQALADARHENVMTYLRPDAKAQVTVKYDENRKPLAVSAVVISTQHHPSVSQEQIK